MRFLSIAGIVIREVGLKTEFQATFMRISQDMLTQICLIC